MERKEALRLGIKKYNTGRPCRHGHLADRYSDSGACVDCLKVIAGKSENFKSEIKIKTKEIFLFSQEPEFPAVKMILDGLVTMYTPELPPDSVNPMPFGYCKQISNLTYQLKVRVPLAAVETAYEMGKMLLKKETKNV